MSDKPLGHKNYGSIGHLPGSRRGPGDHGVNEGQARICTLKARDRHDLIIVQEKLDGSNVGVARIGDQIVALGRAGYRAETSRFEQHQLFAYWVRLHTDRFLRVLRDGERLVGEWLAQAHGTRYDLDRVDGEPFVAFDLMRGQERATHAELIARVLGEFETPKLLSMGAPFSIQQAMDAVRVSGHGAIDPVEGAVWRVERQGKVDFLAKYVRPDKVDGCYLPDIAGCEPVWNWRPSHDLALEFAS